MLSVLRLLVDEFHNRDKEVLLGLLACFALLELFLYYQEKLHECFLGVFILTDDLGLSLLFQ
jgi:hypothetical protein